MTREEIYQVLLSNGADPVLAWERAGEAADPVVSIADLNRMNPSISITPETEAEIGKRVFERDGYAAWVEYARQVTEKKEFWANVGRPGGPPLPSTGQDAKIPDVVVETPNTPRAQEAEARPKPIDDGWNVPADPDKNQYIPAIDGPVHPETGIDALTWYKSPQNTDLLSEASKSLSEVIGLDPNRTVSSQAFEAAQQGNEVAQLLCSGLDILDPNHCRDANAVDPYRTAAPARRRPGGCCPKLWARLSK